MLVGYAANADRKEDWLTNPLPLQDSQQPEGSASYTSIKSLLPANPLARDTNGFTITGHIDGQTDWKNLILPILACGFMGLLIPSSEVWRYTSWQDFPERKEKIVLQREKNEKK
jgi:hypothetical protein